MSLNKKNSRHAHHLSVSLSLSLSLCRSLSLSRPRDLTQHFSRFLSLSLTHTNSLPHRSSRALSAGESEQHGACDSCGKRQHVAWPRPSACSCARCSTRSRAPALVRALFLFALLLLEGGPRKVWAGAARNCAQTTEQKERTAQRGVAGAMRATGASAVEGAGNKQEPNAPELC